jgi:ATP-dependent Clp protease ATP-binding subunit ClpA
MFSASVEMLLHVAYREAVSRRHTTLTLEHLLFALAHDLEGERILVGCGADLPRLRRDLEHFLDKSVEQFPRGFEKDPDQTRAFRRVLQTAVLHVQSAGRGEVQAGDLVAAILQQPQSFAAQLLELQGITRLDVLNYISHGITKAASVDGTPGGATSPMDRDEPRPPTPRDALGAYAVNVTERARAGALDPVIGRTVELQRTLEILCRRRKNNPVFVGDAGVGKTALAEGLAQRLLDDDVPEILRGAEIFNLDTAALLAGTRFRGDFEERFKAVIAALKKRRMPILFIDEIHATIGAGATTGGTMDLATLIKPVLTGGDLRLVGSTTFDDFKQIEKDRALARRLQKVTVDEPTLEETTKILRGLRPRYEEHHGVRYTDEALEAAATLAKRHLRDYRLPDSAIDVMDEAGSMVRLQAAAAAAHAAATGPAGVGPREEPNPARAGWHGDQQEPVAQNFSAAKTRRASAAKTRAAQDSGAVTATRGSRAERAQHPAADEAAASVPVVSNVEIERVIARMARIPEKQATSSDRERLKTLEESLRRVVFGQDDAVRVVTQAIKRARAGLGQPDRPAGCFLFTGPTGVGKTELARQLAIHLGNEFLRYDMSEYMEKHAVARLIGAPPGYIGFEQGGLLVDAVRMHPYSVVLLDEIEKAHPDLFNILLQVMDHATLTDNAGRRADFRQAILIMTSNAGSREMSASPIGFAGLADGDAGEHRRQAARSGMRAALERIFSPEFRNRLDAIVGFTHLTLVVMETIVDKFILQLEAQLAERHVAIHLEPEARRWLAEKGYDPVYGARPLARVIQTEVRDRLTDEILFGRLENGGTTHIALESGALTFRFDEPTQPKAKAPPV